MKRAFSGMADHLNASVRFSTDELSTLAKISTWARWFVIVASYGIMGFEADYTNTQLVVAFTGGAVVAVVNATFHFVIWRRRSLRWQWLVAMGLLDIAIVTMFIGIRGGLDSYYYVAYFPVLAMFAMIFSSFPLVASVTGLTILTYVLTALFTGDGVQADLAEDRELYVRVVFLLPVVVAVYAVASYERSGRRSALQREQSLLNDRLELSQTIHDTTAQAAYMIGLGIDEAIQLAGRTDSELNKTLRATSSLTKSVIWELRRPIDVGRIFEGANLSDVLRAHILTFNAITSMDTDMEIEGVEPSLPVEVRTRLFSIAHNSLANAFRHSSAAEVNVQLQFSKQSVRLAISDDGIGLPDNYESMGRGFQNMRRDAERIGGQLLVESPGEGTSTTIACTIQTDPAWIPVESGKSTP